ncbi:DMT family transporter [Stappia sp.]|uniref:DMT family transporter n=1 Tax=Stappia sp. TaxID=1870903 RepID=UPI003A9A0109
MRDKAGAVTVGTAPQTDETGRAHVAMLGFVFLVSTSFPVGHAITAALDPAVLTALRFSIAAAIFAGMATVKRQWHRPKLARLPVYFLIALLLDIFFVTMFEALRLTSALNAGAVFTLLPAFTALAGLMLLGQRISRFQAICLAVGAAGALLVLFGSDLSRLARLEFGEGERIYLVGVAAYAFYAPLMRLFNKGEPLEHFNFWILVCGAVMLLAYGREELAATDWSAVPLSVYAGIAYLAVFPTATSFFCATYASLRLPSGPVMAYTYLLPSFVLAETLALGASWPGLWTVAGVLVTAVATILLQRRPPAVPDRSRGPSTCR